jgi:hypothetical protein
MCPQEERGGWSESEECERMCMQEERHIQKETNASGYDRNKSGGFRKIGMREEDGEKQRGGLGKGCDLS